MKDFLRESFSYGGIYRKMRTVRRVAEPQQVFFGEDSAQVFLYYEPPALTSDKTIVWVHGGGWNAGSPQEFDFVGQCVAGAGYRFVSLGYRLSPKFKYPCQIQDVCAGFQAALSFLREKGVNTSRLVVSGPSAGAHLAALLCYGKDQPVDRSVILGFVGAGGPYCFTGTETLAVRILLHQLFPKGYDRTQAEPCAQLSPSKIPMLLIQSRHDGLIEFACAERFAARAMQLGIPCELYAVEDPNNTHSWYTAGVFLENRQESRTLDRFFSWIEKL